MFYSSKLRNKLLLKKNYYSYQLDSRIYTLTFAVELFLKKRFFFKASLDRNGNLLRMNYLFYNTKNIFYLPQGQRASN